MNEQRPKSEFNDVDRANNPGIYIQLLDVQQSMVFIQQYKQRARALLGLQPGHLVLEVGVGTGEDAREMAKLVAPTGQVVGLDLSQILLDVALQRTQGMSLPLRFVQGDVHQLPFTDNLFDRCYADKTFEHLPNPKLAISELIRVTKPGGQLVIVDPDHEAQVLDTPYPDVTRRFFRFRSDGVCQPDIAHRSYALFKEAGLTHVYVEPLIRVTTDYETIRPVANYVEDMHSAQEYGVVTKEEAEKWLTYLRDAMHTERFFHAMVWFITSGCKPLDA